MDSSEVVDQETSGIVDSMHVNGTRQSPNDASNGIIYGCITADDGGLRCRLNFGDESDDSFSGSVAVSKSKRKSRWYSGNDGLNETDDYETILKSRKLGVPIFVQPLRSVKSSELEDSDSPDSVKLGENLAPASEAVPILMCPMENFEVDSEVNPPVKNCRQFWKAGDYEGNCQKDLISSSVGMDHVRVHPKFLHSNATSHKWALGAFAELLDNSLDEICNGATYVHIDVLKNENDGSKMLLIEDDGGGMCPDKMRRCMSLGYSTKRNMPNTIGQYGNGFKTSTMRLGADVLVFSRCSGSDQRGPTKSIGMLSYTFLRDTGKEDIVVPMVDFEFKEDSWNKMMRSEDDWNKNLEIIAQWSPYSTKELLEQFNFLKDNGTRIIIYNLWEDDEGHPELDFDADSHDIQIKGANREEKNIKMAQQYPNSRHYLTFRHSLRIYSSVLYLRLPPGFRIILRGKDVEHHNVVDDLMLTKQLTYKPNQLPAGTVQKSSDTSATVTIGFIKDARSHIDVQGFNVYHKNRLIKPFWRIWNPAGSDGRGVIGVLEANFVEPAHDKQGFERTSVLSRLESRLTQIQKDYWTKNCHEVGYAPRRRSTMESNYNVNNLSCRPNVPNFSNTTTNSILPTTKSVNFETVVLPSVKVHVTTHPGSTPGSTCTIRRSEPLPPALTERVNHLFGQPQESETIVYANGISYGSNETASFKKPSEEINDMKGSFSDPHASSLAASWRYEKDKCRTLESKVASLEKQLCEVTQKLEEKEKEQMLQINFSSAEVLRKESEIMSLKKKLLGATATIRELRGRTNQAENSNTILTSKTEPDGLAHIICSPPTKSLDYF